MDEVAGVAGDAAARGAEVLGGGALAVGCRGGGADFLGLGAAALGRGAVCIGGLVCADEDEPGVGEFGAFCAGTDAGAA